MKSFCAKYIIQLFKIFLKKKKIIAHIIQNFYFDYIFTYKIQMSYKNLG